LGRIRQLNRDNGVIVQIVEPKLREVLEICHRVYCLKCGKVT
jgi:ABC-type branched-subunit amino acid transport system ATPase component